MTGIETINDKNDLPFIDQNFRFNPVAGRDCQEMD
jgi:hypothetical protein